MFSKAGMYLQNQIGEILFWLILSANKKNENIYILFCCFFYPAVKK
jgi:hypothetical protein